MSDKLTDAKLKQLIITATKRLDSAHAESLDAAKELGQLLAKAKKRHPSTKAFEAFLKEAGGVKLARAYQLIGMASGRVEAEKLRKENAARNREHRAKKKEQAKSKPILSRDRKTEPDPKVIPSRGNDVDTEASAEAAKAAHLLDGSASAFKSLKIAIDQFVPRMNSEHVALIEKYLVEAIKQKARAS